MFTALSLIQLMTSPLSSLFQNIPALLGGVACCKRIETYLLAKPRHDPRKVLRQKEAANSGSIVTENQKTSFIASVPDTNIVTIKDGRFGWDSTDENEDKRDTLRDVNVSIHHGGLTVITGPVAAGKSTLLKGILGETSQATGVTLTSELDAAYCDQTVWLKNTTIRDNIVAYSLFDAPWYSEVLHAAALDADLDTWPEGDKTLVGSNGMALSGGQRRRIVCMHTGTSFSERSASPFPLSWFLTLSISNRQLPVLSTHGDK